jgi:hypothetical protein
MRSIITNRIKYISGDIIVSVLVFATIVITVTSGLVMWGGSLLKSVKLATEREQAFQIAEAGVNYYMWHLAQYPEDYEDGTGSSGPYVHDFVDKNDNKIGEFELTINPPLIGSTKVEIISKGTLSENTNISRTIKATLAIPSLAQYAIVANDNLRFGAGTSVYGPIKSNYGIRFDGTAYNVVSSALSTYTDPDTNTLQHAVYTTVSPADPQPPTQVSDRSDVFKAGRVFPSTPVDFAGLLSNLQELQTIARDSGYLYAQSQYSGQPAKGYKVVLNANGTFTLYVVRSTISPPSGCSSSQTQWGTWSINQTALLGTYNIPAQGVLFFEDHVWVEGQIADTRLTIAAGKFPQVVGQEPNITINNNLRYTYTDGRDVLGLIAQGNVNVGLVSANTLTIDGALMAQNGRVGRFYYNSNCRVSNTNYYTRSSLTLNGMIATNKRYGFAYTDGTGYSTRNLNYDANLLYSPPPSFPLATNQYQMIGWAEIMLE